MAPDVNPQVLHTGSVRLAPGWFDLSQQWRHHWDRSPLSERFLHGFACKEAPEEDVEAQVPEAHQGQQAQAQEVGIDFVKDRAVSPVFTRSDRRQSRSRRKSSISSTS